MNYVLILGAKSDVGQALAGYYAARGYSLYLAARNSLELEEAVSTLKREYGVDARTLEFDALQVDTFQNLYLHLEPKPVGVITTVGYLGDQSLAEQDIGEAQKIINTNFTGLVLFLTMAAQDFSRRRTGFIVGISSVAGERGRKSNYFYGSAKAGFTAFLSGLRNRYCNSGIQVLTVQLGFVRTKMTAGMKLPGLLTLSAEEAAKGIFDAQQGGRDVAYLSPLWWWVMLLVRSLPERLFKRLDW